MSNSAKNAKSIGLSVAGILVALPADADLASITWVERAIQNQTPIPAGSVITGYASGSYGSYLLAGSTVGGPYSGVSISDIGSQMSPYISGDAIPFGFAPTGATPTWLLGKGTNEDGAGGAWLNISNVATTIAEKLSGSLISFPEKTIPGGGYVLVNENSSGSGAAWTPVTTLGERINFASGGGSMILAGDGAGSTAGWMAASNLAQYIPGSQITGYQDWPTQYPTLLNNPVRGGTLLPTDKILAAPASGGSFASITLGAALIGTGVINVLTNSIFGRNGSTLGSSIGGYGSYASDATGTSYMYVLAGGSLDVRNGSAAKWLDMRKMGNHIGGYSQNAEDETQTHILAGDGGTDIPGWTSISTFGTLIGTVNGSQVKIEQTATAAELQAKTGTIYFPVVQDGKIYGVTLNDFYILMNAQF